MTLSRQLLCIILLTLALPWAGCQYARELEITLRDNQIMTLTEIARSASQQLRPDMADVNQGKVALHATQLLSPAILDGYADEWQAVNAQLLPVTAAKQNAPPKTILLRAGVFENQLYVFFSIPDASIRYYNPMRGKENGDRLALAVHRQGAPSGQLYLTTSAPGAVNVIGSKPLAGRIKGYWQQTSSGHAIELSLPIELVKDEIQFTYIDADTHASERYEMPKGQVIAPHGGIKETLGVYARLTRRLYVINSGGWIIAQTGSLSDDDSAEGQYRVDEPIGESFPTFPKAFDGLITQLYRLILSNRDGDEPVPINPTAGRMIDPFVQNILSGHAAGQWRQRRLSEALIITGVPIFDTQDVAKPVGAVLLEQQAEPILSVENQAISRLFRLTFSVISVITIALLSFAAILSLRINRLSQAAKQVLSADGQFSEKINTSTMNDEIGELTRSLVLLQNRLGTYTQYLRSLASKLSHELRTPLAIVRSSLENLEQSAQLEPGSKIYLQRANEGLARLRYIVTAMSEASRVEQSIQSAEQEIIILNENLVQLVESYQLAAQGHKITMHLPPEHLRIRGNNELIAQLLDKLFENAQEFTPEGKTIDFSLMAEHGKAVLIVANDGPLLPDTMQHNLFDSLVSLRERTEEKTHLGLGLHIVKLIAEFHGGSVSAENKADGSGVLFTIKLPLI